MSTRLPRDGEYASPLTTQCMGCYETIPPGHVHACPPTALARFGRWLMLRVPRLPRRARMWLAPRVQEDVPLVVLCWLGWHTAAYTSPCPHCGRDISTRPP